MALINRVTRLFTADLHAVLDRIEEPEVLLKQAIREMEEELVSTEQRIKWLQHEDEELQRRIDQIEQSLAEMGEELDVCFASDEEELARNLIRRRLEAQRIVASLAQRRTATEKMLAETQQLLDENRGHLESLRQKADLLTEDTPCDASHRGELGLASGFTVSSDEVEVAFLREKQRRSAS